jgi:Fe-S cluster assembly protein SufD
MTQTLTKIATYQSEHRAFEERFPSDGQRRLRELRESGLASFAQLGFPTARRGNEKWKYTNVGPIAGQTFAYPLDLKLDGIKTGDVRQIAPWDDSWTNLVFLDGHFSEYLSTHEARVNGIQITSLAEAIRSDEDVVEKHLGRLASVDDDGFTALNNAFIQDGAFVHISEGKVLENPLNLVFISTDREKPTVSFPRVLVVAGAGSKSTIVESYVSTTQDGHFTNSVSEMVLEEGAEVEHYRVLNEGEDASHIGVARVHQSDNSSFSSKAFVKGTGLGRYDLYVKLDGPGSLCTLKGLYVTSGSEHIDNFINIDHTKPSATSRLYYKGILDGKSRAVFGGTVWVRPGAIKTDAQQDDKNLVLSPDAEVDSKPALFIYADDVKCGHGANAGKIGMDSVFYMRSRGLDVETASRLLIFGFAREIIDTVEMEELHSYLEKLFLESLPSYKFEF